MVRPACLVSRFAFAGPWRLPPGAPGVLTQHSRTSLCGSRQHRTACLVAILSFWPTCHSIRTAPEIATQFLRDSAKWKGRTLVHKVRIKNGDSRAGRPGVLLSMRPCARGCTGLLPTHQPESIIRQYTSQRVSIFAKGKQGSSHHHSNIQEFSLPI